MKPRTLSNRLASLEARKQSTPATDDMFANTIEYLQKIYARLSPENITEETMARESCAWVLAVGFCAPQPLPDFIVKRVGEFAEADDALGTWSRLLLRLQYESAA